MPVKQKNSSTLAISEATRLTASVSNGSNANVRVYRGKISDREGTEHDAIVAIMLLDQKPVQPPSRGQPWASIAELFAWRNKKPGRSALRDADGNLSGFTLQCQLSRYHEEYDTRPTRETVTVQERDEFEF